MERINIYGNNIRRSGKTTKCIDDAIQVLFTKGKIYIPSKQELKDDAELTMLGKESQRKLLKVMDFLVVDYDWHMGRAQDDMKRRLIKRLQSEHNSQFVVRGNWIELVNKENLKL